MPNPTGNAVVSELSRAGKYLLFRLGREEYGLGVLKVREIVSHQDPVPVPHSPAFVKGVINLRGKVVPVMDLRERLGLPPDSDPRRTSIIIVQVKDVSPPVLVGAIVDEVLEVIDIQASDIEDAPDFGRNLGDECILGVAKVQARVRILLDVDKTLVLDALCELPLRK